MSEVTKVPFFKKVLTFINGGDEANVKAVLAAAKKKWSKQVSIKTKAIEKIKTDSAEEIGEVNEYLVEAKDELAEAYLNINPEIKGKDNVKYYINESYEDQIATAKEEVERLEEKAEEIQEAADSRVKELEKEIAQYEADLEAIA